MTGILACFALEGRDVYSRDIDLADRSKERNVRLLAIGLAPIGAKVSSGVGLSINISLLQSENPPSMC